jgi:hypothetical protein
METTNVRSYYLTIIQRTRMKKYRNRIELLETFDSIWIIESNYRNITTFYAQLHINVN